MELPNYESRGHHGPTDPQVLKKEICQPTKDMSLLLSLTVNQVARSKNKGVTFSIKVFQVGEGTDTVCATTVKQNDLPVHIQGLYKFERFSHYSIDWQYAGDYDSEIYQITATGITVGVSDDPEVPIRGLIDSTKRRLDFEFGHSAIRYSTSAEQTITLHLDLGVHRYAPDKLKIEIPRPLLERKMAEHSTKALTEALAASIARHLCESYRLERNTWLRLLRSSRSDTPATLLASLAEDENELVRKAVGNNPIASEEVLAKLATDKCSEVRAGVARNVSASTDLLAQLAVDEIRSVRQFVAENPSVSAEVLGRLATDKDSSVQSSAASVLRRLAYDKSTSVARNPSVSTEVQAALAVDKNLAVRNALATNPSAGVDTLARLVADKDRLVRIAVAGNPSASAEVQAALAADKDPDLRRALARNPSASTEVQASLAADKDRDVRRALAKNAKAGADVLAGLADEKDSVVRFNVAQNPSTPADVLTRLASDDILNVRRGVAENPVTSPELFAQMIDTAKQQEDVPDLTGLVIWS